MKANDVKIMLRMMRKDNKASVAVQSFPHTNLEHVSLQLWETISFLDQEAKMH